MKINSHKRVALTGITTAVLTACSSGGTCGTCAIPVPATGSKLIIALKPVYVNVQALFLTDQVNRLII